MAFDGITVRCVAHELDTLLRGGRIDKIYMPLNDTLIITVRSLGENYKLLVSCNPSLPRIHLTEKTRENPEIPPPLCMLLRKKLSGGRIISIKSPGIERICEIEVESQNEMGDTVSLKLICEIMGRHSNIILVDENGRICDCMRRIDGSISSMRLVLPGMPYDYPPGQNKILPTEADEQTATDVLYSCPNEKKLDSHLLENFGGLSPMVAREFVSRAVGNADAVYMHVSKTQLDKMCQIICTEFKNIAENVYCPVFITDDTGVLKDFSAVDITQYGTQRSVKKPTLIRELDGFYSARETHFMLRDRGSDLIKNVSNLLDRARRKAALQHEAVENSKNMEKMRRNGDLITANIYRIQKGDSKLICEDYYEETCPQIEIALETSLTPSENAQKYFARYTKLKNTAIAAKIQLESSLADIEYLESVQSNIENCETLSELSEIKKELVSAGYLKNTENRKNKRPKKETAPSPTHFKSSDGFDIFVGKNNLQNDYLTLKMAKNSDLWFHVKNIPGSHTVIFADGKEISETAIVEAASLAAYHSKAKMSQNVAVDFTKIKFVKKPSGAKPGKVIYTDYQTLYVNPTTEEKIKEMKV